MTRGIDNDEWLKNIGAVTVHDDDDTFGVDSGSRSMPPLADDEAQPDPADDLPSQRQSASFEDDGEESPLGYAEDDYGGAGPGLFGSTVDVGGSVVDLDSISSDTTTASPDSSPRRFTPWVVAAFGAAAVVATIITLVVTTANSPSAETSGSEPAPFAPRVVEVAPPIPPRIPMGRFPLRLIRTARPGPRQRSRWPIPAPPLRGSVCGRSTVRS